MRYLDYFSSTALIFLLSVSTINAQIEWTYVYDNNTRTSINSALMTENGKLIMNLSYGLSCPNNRILGFSSEGTHEWTFSETSSTLGADLSLVQTFDGTLYSVGFHGEEDYTSGEEHLSVHKINFDGEVEMKREIPWNLNQYDHMIPCGFDWHMDWGFIIVDCYVGNLVRLDQDANLLEVIELGQRTDNVFFADQDKFIIIQNQTIRLIDGSGHILSNHTLSSKVQSAGKMGDNFYFISRDAISFFDEELNLVKDVALDPDFNVISTQLINEKFYSLSKDENNLFLHVLEDESWDLVHTSPMVFNPEEFLISDNLLVLIGNVAGQMAMYAISKNSSDLNYVFPDLELLDVEMIDLEISKTNIPVYEDDVIESLSFTPGLWLKNNSPFPVTSFGLHANKPGGFNCARPHYYELNEDIVIESGEAIFVETNRYFTHGDHRTSLEICFTIKAPNGDIEIIRSNNTHCVDISTTGIDEKEGLDQNIQIFPNPVSDWLVIDMSSANLSDHELNLTVVDMLGKEVFNSTLINGNKEKINVSSFANGVYIIKLHRNGMTIKKQIFVKN